MRTDPTVLICGLLCLWPLFVGFLGFLIGRYRPRFRSPIAVDRPVKVTDPQVRQALRAAAKKPSPPTDNIGFGG